MESVPTDNEPTDEELGRLVDRLTALEPAEREIFFRVVCPHCPAAPRRDDSDGEISWTHEKESAPCDASEIREVLNGRKKAAKKRG